METRVADLSDLDDLRRLVAGFRGQLKRIHPDDTALEDNLKHLLTTDEAEFLLVFDDTRRAVGYIQQRYRFSVWFGGLEANLEDLFVSEGHRGHGFGTKLTQFAIERAFDRGCRSIKLDTNESNQAAIRIYERLGFWSGSTRFPDSRQLSFEKPLEPRCRD